MHKPELLTFRPTAQDWMAVARLRQHLFDKGVHTIGTTTILREALVLAQERLDDLEVASQPPF